MSGADVLVVLLAFACGIFIGSVATAVIYGWMSTQ